MRVFPVALVLATFSCSLVAGFLFAFAAVVMPGLRRLDDGAFIRAFQVIDGVIQGSQPLFVLVWVGSVPALLTAAVSGLCTLSGSDRLLIVVAAVVYLVGVQLPTASINVPLNNTLQKVDHAALDAAARKRVRELFEGRWNRWNAIRTACASLTCLLLVLVLLRS